MFNLNTLKKISIRLLKAGLIFLVVIYGGVFLYYRFGWRNHYSKQETDVIVSTISNTPNLSEEFYTLYDKVYDNRHERITTRYWKNFWTEFVMINAPIQDNWQYVTANMMPYHGFRYTIAPMTLAFKINSVVPPEKCFDYVMTDMFKDYCKVFKLKDTIINLKTQDRIVDFIIAHERPWFYRTHSSQFKREKDSLLLVLLKK